MPLRKAGTLPESRLLCAVVGCRGTGAVRIGLDDPGPEESVVACQPVVSVESASAPAGSLVWANVLKAVDEMRGVVEFPCFADGTNAALAPTRQRGLLGASTDTDVKSNSLHCIDEH